MFYTHKQWKSTLCKHNTPQHKHGENRLLTFIFSHSSQIPCCWNAPRQGNQQLFCCSWGMLAQCILTDVRKEKKHAFTSIYVVDSFISPSFLSPLQYVTSPIQTSCPTAGACALRTHGMCKQHRRDWEVALRVGVATPLALLAP